MFIFLATGTAGEDATSKTIAIGELRVGGLDIQAGPDSAAAAVGGAAAVEVEGGVAEAEEDIERTPQRARKPDYLMKFPNLLTRFSHFLAIFLLAFIWAIFPAPVHATEPSDAQQSFPTPDAAIAALQIAVAANDQTALASIFGPQFHELMTGDKVQDANNLKKLAADLAERCHPVKDGDDKITLEIGSNNWPMPIPLVQTNGKWRFDTAAGKEEIINRHVGKDELTAIGVCRAYVTAQRQYVRENPAGGTAGSFAQHFKSSPGRKDGLYWAAASNEPASPFGPLVAEAQAEGYVLHRKGTEPHPFHGYYFRILTGQGEAAPGGKMSYLSEGAMTKGFALVAYPETWDKSGVMTFIVSQDGQVFQRNFGEGTSQVAAALKEYDPDSDWTLVEDEGILRAASER